MSAKRMDQAELENVERPHFFPTSAWFSALVTCSSMTRVFFIR